VHLFEQEGRLGGHTNTVLSTRRAGRLSSAVQKTEQKRDKATVTLTVAFVQLTVSKNQTASELVRLGREIKPASAPRNTAASEA